MGFATPPAYPDRYDPATSTWFRELFNPGNDIQTAELNEIQSMMDQKFALLGGAFFADGTFIDKGGVPTVSLIDNVLTVSITAGKLWADAVHTVPAGAIAITGVGTEVISLIITEVITTPLQDPTLYDNVTDSENYGYAGADRLSFSYAYALNSAQGIPIITLIDGQVIQKSGSNGFLDQIYAILAQRTYEQSGSFLATRPLLSGQDTATINNNPTKFLLYVDKGVVYNQGYRFENLDKLNLGVNRPLTGQATVSEPQSPVSGTLAYTLANKPILSVETLLATIQSPTISMTRGLTVNGSDAIPSTYQPVYSVISIVQGGTTYVQGRDFNRSGNLIIWLSSGTYQPATGTTYSLVVDYTIDLIKGIRTLASVTGETHVVPSTGTTTLGNLYVRGSTLILTDTTSGVVQINGTDYTLASSTGVITWINRHAGDTVSATYSYWIHTVEGDFVARDSFVDSFGNVLYNYTPSITPTGLSINYLNQISFDVIGGRFPVIGVSFYVSYHYTLGRIDVLAWDQNGIISILPGVPGITPAAPNVDSNHVPIAKLKLPAESTYSQMVIEYYDNVTLLVTDLQQMNQQIQDLQYDIGVFQLQQSAANTPTATNKRGIFADSFSDPTLADTGNSFFNGTFDFLARTFMLPRTAGVMNPAVSSATNASLYQDIWMLNFAEQKSLSQPYRSLAQVINQFGSVNQNAKVVISPAVAVVATENVSVIANAHNQGFTAGNIFQVNTAQSLLLTEVSQSGAAAQSLGNTANALADAILNKVPVDPAWTSAINSSSTTVTSSNYWATVLTYLNVVTGTPLPSTAITVTGSNFLANDHAISLQLDGQPINMTATGSTVQETATGYTGCVRASNTGTWTATFLTPNNLAQGLHTLNFTAHSATDLTVVTSLASTTFRNGGISETIEETVTLTAIPPGFPCAWVPAVYICAVLGFNPTTDILGSVGGPFAGTLALAIAAANTSAAAGGGVAYVTFAALTAAVGLAVGATGWRFPNYPAMLNGIPTLLSGNGLITSTNVASIEASILAAYPYTAYPVGNYSACELDPIAQTFTLGTDSFVTSINLYFATAPSSQVGVAIAQSVNGVPTRNYLSTAYLSPSSINTTGATKFTFDKPVFLNGGTEYAFVVLTNDNTAALWSCVLGQNDILTNQLIVSNPASGTLLNSPNASSWSVVAGHDLQFDINTASFTQTSGVINFGQLTFAQASNLISFYMPFSEPSQDTAVVYQYSIDNQSWLDFAPLAEKDMLNANASIFLRILLTGTAYLSPVLFNYPTLLYSINQLSGNYVHREFDLPQANARYIDVYCNCDTPGNTSVTFYASSDSGATWHLMTEDTTTGYPINVDGTYFTRHFVYDGGSGATIQSIKTRCALQTTVNFITPKLQDYIVIARST